MPSGNKGQRFKHPARHNKGFDHPGRKAPPPPMPKTQLHRATSTQASKIGVTPEYLNDLCWNLLNQVIREGTEGLQKLFHNYIIADLMERNKRNPKPGINPQEIADSPELRAMAREIAESYKNAIIFENNIQKNYDDRLPGAAVSALD